MGMTTSTHVDISRKSKAAVLAALFDAARCGGGMAALHWRPGVLDPAVAEELTADGQPLSFDYLQGRALKIDLSKDLLRVDLYDRDNGGEGTAEEIIAGLPDVEVPS